MHDAVEVCGLFLVEGGGGLVENDVARIGCHRTGEGEHLLLEETQLGYERVRVDVYLEPAQHVLCPLPVPAGREKRGVFAQQQPGGQVLVHRQGRGEGAVDFLRQQHDPVFYRIGGPPESHRGTVDQNRSLRGWELAGGDVHEGGLACSVEPEQCVHTAGGDGEVHLGEDVTVAVVVGNTGELKLVRHLDCCSNVWIHAGHSVASFDQPST